MAGAAAIGLAGIAHGHAGHDETDYGKSGDPRKPARIVQIVMREADGKMLFQSDRLTIRKSEQVRFLPRNNGVLEHEFVIGTLVDNLEHMKEMAQHPDMVHDDPNARRPQRPAAGAQGDGRDRLAIHQGGDVRFFVPDPRPPRGRDVRNDRHRVSEVRPSRTGASR
jgi:hypothetical protein